MNFRQFALGLTFSFGIAWLAVVVVPFFKLRNPAPVSFKEGVDEITGIYHPKRSGRVTNGYGVYAENGCYQCHTQVIRNTDAGNDLGRPNWGGLKLDPETGKDTRRESNVFDYSGLDFAPIGVTRLGPDLMNVGRRIPAKIKATAGPDATVGEIDGETRNWLYLHLYNPRLNPELRDWSSCPSFTFLFEEREITGERSDDALEVRTKPGMEIVPGEKARALVSYLMSLKHDDPVPDSMDYSPADQKGGDSEG
jgi:cytochrome c oxidase cbb3-type subunit 2